MPSPVSINALVASQRRALDMAARELDDGEPASHINSVATFKGLGPATPRASAAARGSSKKRDTRCELVLRKALTSLGVRYRIDASDLDGHPDIAFRTARVVVFCDGDYWHGRDLDSRLAKLAAGHNATYWVSKIRANVARDLRVTAALEGKGWLVARYWETDIHSNPARIANEIAALVRVRRSR